MRASAILSLFLAMPIAAAELPPAEPPPRFEVAFEFDGLAEMSERELRNALAGLRSELARTGVDQGAVDDAVYEVERHARSLGFRAVRVDGEWEPQGDSGYVIRFLILEGPRSRLESLTLEGNATIESDELERCFLWPRGGFLSTGERIFTEGALEDGVACVAGRYELEGHVFADAIPSVSDDGLGGVRVHLEIREGPRIFLRRRPRIEGAIGLDAMELQDALAIEVPCVYTPRLPLLLKGRILDHARDRGYRFAEVDVKREISPETGEATIDIAIDEGPPSRIAEIRVSGNLKTADWVILDRVKLSAGDLYSERLVRDSHRSLLRSGLFSSVVIQSVALDPSRETLALDVALEEKPRYQVGVLVGYGTYELLRGKAYVEDINLFGSGHRLLIEGRGSFKGEGARVEYTNPFVFTDTLSHSAESFYSRRENPSFVQRDFGGETGLGYRWTDNVRQGLTYRLERSESLDVSEPIPEDLRQSVFLSSVLFGTVLDFRNSVLDPDRGSTHSLGIQYTGKALGSELDFLRYNASTNWILPFGGGVRLVVSARLGLIQKLETSQVIPLQERYFLGGEYTIRSFLEDEAGPKVGGKPIGGDAYTLYNAELRVPVGLLDGLQLAGFVNVGSLTEDAADVGGERYYTGVGVGIRYVTPFGPLRVDLGFNPHRRDDDDLYALQFGLGYPF